MKKLVFTFTALMILLIFKTSDNDEISKESTQAPEQKVQQKLAENPEDLSLKTEAKKLIRSPSQVKNEEFESLLTSVKKDIQKCQRDIQSLFPEELVQDDKIPYKTIKEMKFAITKLYQVISSKNNQTQALIEFLKNTQPEKLDQTRVFKELSSMSDCGEVEEEEIIDTLINYVSDQPFGKKAKSSLTQHLLSEFNKQLQNPKAGFQNLLTKVESMESLVDEDILPSEIQDKLDRINEMIEDAENDFRAALPKDFSIKKHLSVQEVIDIKQREQDIMANLKFPIQELIEEGMKSLE